MTDILPGDPRYAALVEGYNHRFTGRPDHVRQVRTTAEVAAAVREAVDSGRRVAVRSGGHCFEDFFANPEIQMLIDLAPMSAVSYDAHRRAIMVEAGITLGALYPILYDTWGVTIPGGTCFEVGVGGHITGGGYGHLSRRDGLVVDHLYAVEVVVVDESGTVDVVVATREPDDPHHELWWATAGGGGGSFGVVTRFWLRSPGVDSDDPSRLLPTAPRRIRRCDVLWSWDGMTEDALTRLIANYCGWLERHSAVDAPETQLWSNLIVMHRSAGIVALTAVIDDAVEGAARMLDDQLAAIGDGTGLTPRSVDRNVVDWMASWMPSYSWPSDPKGRYKNKAGYLRRGYTDKQLATIFRYLADPEYANPAAGIVLTAFGGQVNAVPSGATAAAQRDSVVKASYSAGAWQSPDDDAVNTAWVRAFYRDVYAESGGVPVSGDVSDGSYISYPDVDLADPEWNTSGVPWHTLYFKDNYPRLQRVKRRYDPRDIFRHGLSVRLPD
ncbi:FAD-binding protein [Micromonospora sp. PSH03]|uniref:FAD-dependent oxidoreductase n=1 Tax=Micromonospora salmantinae TaxID=2911211 RepID=UPI001EE7D061|nr:FAD-binding protein [Micromonospora salmantinae]MCG5454787.1 FAD-binding protein [Micromonospora salmantinae]